MAKSEILKHFILGFEGGFVNNKLDAGHETNKGVTLSTFRMVYGKDKTASDLRKITDEQWMHIFKKLYWDACRADEIMSQSVANMLVDFAYNSGSGNAIRKIQGIVGVKVDGILGKNTLSAINGFKQGQWVLFDKLKVARISFLNAIVKNKPSQEAFLKGWLRRIGNIQYGKLVCNDGKKIICK